MARRAFLEWKDVGKPSMGEYLDEMKETRSRFKSALKECRENEIHIRNEMFRKKFSAKDKSSFWKRIKASSREFNVTKMDNETGTNEIETVFKNKYEAVLNDQNSTAIPNEYFTKTLNSMGLFKFDNEISENETMTAINRPD